MAEVLVALGGDGNIGDQPSQRLVVREPLMVLLLFLVAVAIEVGFGTCGNDLYKMALTRKGDRKRHAELALQIRGLKREAEPLNSPSTFVKYAKINRRIIKLEKEFEAIGSKAGFQEDWFSTKQRTFSLAVAKLVCYVLVVLLTRDCVLLEAAPRWWSNQGSPEALGGLWVHASAIILPISRLLQGSVGPTSWLLVASVVSKQAAIYARCFTR